MVDYKTVLTTCPYCGCGCNFFLEVRDNKVVGVIPSKQHSVSRGRLCIKGWSAYEIVNHPDRLTSPLIKKDGKFVKASWDGALNLIAKKLSLIKRKYGSDSIGVFSSARCTNEENYLAQKFTRAVIGTHNVDHCARLCHSPTVSGLIKSFGSGAMTNSIDEIKDAPTIFIIGSNTTEAHPLIGWRVRDAKDKGARIIVVDPRKNDVAKMADIHIQHYPGTDIPLLNAMMNVIITNNLHDKEFIKNRTEGFEELWKAVKKYTPEKVEGITGVDKEIIRKAAIMYGKSKKVSNLYTLGITEHIVGTNNVMSVANLAMITGNVGKESSGVNPLRGQNNVQGACDMAALPNCYPGYQRADDAEVQQKFSKAWNIEPLPLKNGLTETEMLIEAKKGKVKALFIIGEDPMNSDPNTGHVQSALEKLDFLVVTEIFMSTTCQFADVVLPAASFAEKTGTFTNTERNVQLCRKAIHPIKGTKTDFDMICEISKRMGYEMEYGNASEVMDEIAGLTPIYGGISFERISKQVLQWPCLDANHSGTKFLHKDKFSRGLGKLHAIEHKDPAEKTDREYDYILSTGRMLFHYNVGTMTTRSNLIKREYPRNFVEINKNDAKKIGVKDNETVRVATRRGSLVVEVKITDIKEGVIWMPFHFSESQSNKLTNDAFDPISKIGEYKCCAAKVEKCNIKKPQNCN